MTGLRFSCHDSPLVDGLSLWITRKVHDPDKPYDSPMKRELASLTWAPKPENTTGIYEYTSATLTIDPDDARLLMDALWERGIRPTNVAIEIGALPATRAHLDDMRRFAFEKAGLELDPVKKQEFADRFFKNQKVSP